MVRKINSEWRVCVWVIFLCYFNWWAGFGVGLDRVLVKEWIGLFCFVIIWTKA